MGQICIGNEQKSRREMKTELQGYSDCCSQPIYSLDERCPQCGEHCQVIKEEDREPRGDIASAHEGSDYYLRRFNKETGKSYYE